jgi:hypothetical protein
MGQGRTRRLMMFACYVGAFAPLAAVKRAEEMTRR